MSEQKKSGRVRYTDKDLKEQRLSEVGAERLKLIAEQVAENGPVGGFTLKWRNHEVRYGEERGWWRVEWLEEKYGDTEHTGAYVIHGLDEVGRTALAEWNRLRKNDDGETDKGEVQ